MLNGGNSWILSLKVFGCVYFVKNNRPSVGKLDPRAVKCVFMGYFVTQKGYVYYLVVKRLFVSMDVHVLGLEPYYTSSAFSDSPDTTDIEQEGENGDVLLKVGSIPLVIPSSVKKRRMMKKMRRSLYVS
jgi:hypothetical protein